jgi:hypothetical protein
MVNNRKSKKNVKRHFIRKSKIRKFIGGENCGQYIDQTTCVQHRPICLWNFPSKRCIENLEFKKVTEITNPIQSTEKNLEPKVEPLVETTPSQNITSVKSIIDNPQPKQSSIIFGKRTTSLSHSVPFATSTATTAPKKQTITQTTAPIVASKLTTELSKLSVLPRKPDLDNLPLVDPLIRQDQKWPILLDVVNVPGDGDCLFHALRAGLRSLGLYQGTSPELRTLIVSELKSLLKNGDDLSVNFSSDTFYRQSSEQNLTFGQYFETQFATNVKKTPLSKQVKYYLDQMAKGRWGTEIEIWMVSRLFNVNIDVYTLPRIPDPKKPKLSIPVVTGRDGASGSGNYLPLTCLNYNEDTSKPTIRLFNASGNSATGIHYQVLPSSISIDQYLS